MAKLFQLPTEESICCIPLKYAVYCERCRTVSNSPPSQCGLCGSDQIARLEPILDNGPDSPAQGSRQASLTLVRAVSA